MLLACVIAYGKLKISVYMLVIYTLEKFIGWNDWTCLCKIPSFINIQFFGKVIISAVCLFQFRKKAPIRETKGQNLIACSAYTAIFPCGTFCSPANFSGTELELRIVRPAEELNPCLGNIAQGLKLNTLGLQLQPDPSTDIVEYSRRSGALMSVIC